MNEETKEWDGKDKIIFWLFVVLFGFMLIGISASNTDYSECGMSARSGIEC